MTFDEAALQAQKQGISVKQFADAGNYVEGVSQSTPAPTQTQSTPVSTPVQTTPTQPTYYSPATDPVAPFSDEQNTQLQNSFAQTRQNLTGTPFNEQTSNYDPKPFENETINKNETFANRGLSEKQQGELQNLVKNKPADTWTQTDWNNYNYAISLPTQEQKAKTQSFIDTAKAINNSGIDTTGVLTNMIPVSNTINIGDYSTDNIPVLSSGSLPEINTSLAEKSLTDLEKETFQNQKKQAEYWAKAYEQDRKVYDESLNEIVDSERLRTETQLMWNNRWQAYDYDSYLKENDVLDTLRRNAENTLLNASQGKFSSVEDMVGYRDAIMMHNATIATISSARSDMRDSYTTFMTPVNEYYDKNIKYVEDRIKTFQDLAYKSQQAYKDDYNNYKSYYEKMLKKIEEKQDVATACVADESWSNAVAYYGASLDDDPFTMMTKLNQAKADDKVKELIRNRFPDVQAGMGNSLEEWFDALSKSPMYLSGLVDKDSLGDVLNNIKNGQDPITAIYNASDAGITATNISTAQSDLIKASKTAANNSSDVAKVQTSREEDVMQYSKQGDMFDVKRLTYANVVQNLSTDEKKKVSYQAQLENIFNDEEFKGLLYSKDYSDKSDLEKGDNSAWNKVQEKINGILARFGILGTEREKVMAVIQPLYIAYRKNATGVAFSSKEEASYKKFFINDGDSGELLKAKLYGLMFNADAEVRAIFQTHLGGDAKIAADVLSYNAQKEIVDSVKLGVNKSDISKYQNIINNSNSPRKGQVEDTLKNVMVLDTLFHNAEFGDMTSVDNINQFSCGTLEGKYGEKGQCAEFINDLFTIATGKKGEFDSAKTQKEQKVVELGGFTDSDKIYNHTFKQGDIVVMGSGENGHIAMVYNVSPDGIILLEGNANLNGKITITRTGSANTLGVSAVLPVDEYDKDNNLRNIFIKK